ncbi:glycosyltransferase [Alteromonas sp. KUL49]|uniref:glycosyltransferase n=1 Tax=Alteromonas sp. KUL49 TaxID=2480798 RepID=UPI00102EE2A1|nr:glycosyltransferase [Alteromonas sp. KUL49]TAP40772.1 glycosyltransferase family 1 protein [Alteromonas sp. KUL49]GEA10944.1 glycosyl transferase [Alteromonas sp. KUL49]
MNKLVIFGEDWGSHPSSTQHLAKHLLQAHEIVWVNSVGMRAPSFSFKDVQRILQKAVMMFSKSSKSTESTASQCVNTDLNGKLRVINPFTLPWHNNLMVNKFNQRQINRAIGPAMPNEKRTYWLSLPTAMSMIDPTPQDTLVYYCCDDFHALDGVDQRMTAKWEPELIARADVILASSEKLLKKMPTEKSHLLEHGVDYSLFANRVTPHPILNTQRPIIGFYGSISSWVDTDLLYRLATEHPEYDIMLVGKVKTDVTSLVSLPNVVFVDAVNHAELPQFSQHWDVLVMPFKDNEQIRACNPLKLREYLAAGRPVVSTYFPAVDTYSHLVHIAQDATSFVTCVKNAVAFSDEQCKVLRHRQQESVAHHDWAQRALLANKLITNVA